MQKVKRGRKQNQSQGFPEKQVSFLCHVVEDSFHVLFLLLLFFFSLSDHNNCMIGKDVNTNFDTDIQK